MADLVMAFEISRSAIQDRDSRVLEISFKGFSPDQVGRHAQGSGWLLKTRCKYIPVSSMAASLRPTVLRSHPDPGILKSKTGPVGPVFYTTSVLVQAWTLDCLLRDIFILVVGNGSLDGVLGQDRTVHLDRRQGQFLGNVGVLDFQGLIK